MKARTILIVEDEHALGAALSMLVRRMGHIPLLEASAAAGLEAMATTDIAAVVMDIGLPDMSGLEVLDRLRRSGNDVPILIITAHATLDHAIHAQKAGATGYLTKPLDLNQFEMTLRGLLAPTADPKALEGDLVKTCASTLIGSAPCLRETFVGIARACSGGFPALITGPSGSGKSLVAELIHAHGTRCGESLEVLSCQHGGESRLWESTVAGTLVLDEIMDLSGPSQHRLAMWLGSPPSNRPRVLATTSSDPREGVRNGTLREDLFYALTTLTIVLPPLSERSGDIPDLVSHFLGSALAASLTPPVVSALQAYAWPGNVRELRHVLDYAISMSGGGPVFLSHLPSHVAAEAGSGDGIPPGELESAIGRWLDAQLALPESERPDYDLMLEQVERMMLARLLEKHGNRPTHMAAALRMHRATLRQKLRRAGLQRGEE